MNTNTNITSARLAEAAKLAQEIEERQQRLTNLLNGTEVQAPVNAGGKPKRTLPASAKRKIAEAQTKRWARVHAEQAAAEAAKAATVPVAAPAPEAVVA